MRNTRLFLLFLTTTLASGAFAQSLERRVTLKYENEPLGEVLADISNVYDVRFAYSKDFIPVDRRVTVSVVNQPLSSALETIFRETPVVYRNVGGQIALRVDRSKELQLSRLETLPRSVEQTSPIHPFNKEEIAEQRARETRKMDPIRQKRIEQLPGGNRVVELGVNNYPLPTEREKPEIGGDTRLAQISLLPLLGTNSFRSPQVTNKFSFNVFWGANGGVDGLEVGGFFNSVSNDVKGVQVAGLGNTVGGDVTGTQTAGLFNVNMGRMQGVQVAGVFNISGPTQAVQVAGIFNTTAGDFTGMQVAGVFNAAGGKADGGQVAGIFNYAGGDTRSQVSGIFNKARNVSWGQIGSVLNIARRVDGFQIGIINIADTISGMPIGLLNIIKKGYNRVEFSTAETLYGNFGLKLGARSFYNIMHLGVRWDDHAGNRSGTFLSWGLGYGIGTTVTFSPRVLMNIEGVAIHVNEFEPWTSKLNLLNQLRLTVDVRTGRRTSLFAGPTGNIMVSRLYDPDAQVYGSSITPHAFYDETSAGGTNVRMWAGFNAGVRF
jgi:hypothetical protein